MLHKIGHEHSGGGVVKSYFQLFLAILVIFYWVTFHGGYIQLNGIWFDSSK